MALAMNTTVTLSCEKSEEQSGPTIVQSTGVQNYRIQPEVIRLLQESCSNDKLCDHEKGVQCTDPPAHVIGVFERAGFTVTTDSTAGSRKLWILTKTGESGPSNPSGGGGGHQPKKDEDEDAGGEEEDQGEEEED